MNRILFVAVIALTLAALTWGVVIVGGPAYARMEQNDIKRVSDLQRLGYYYRCLKMPKSNADGISPRTACGQLDLTVPEVADPVTGAPYVHTDNGKDQFKICGTFQIGEDVRPWRRAAYDAVINNDVTLDGKQGCVIYYGSGTVWTVQRRSLGS